MRRWFLAAALVAILPGCTGEMFVQSVKPSTPTEPERDRFGAWAARPASSEPADAKSNATLDWKVSQLCTNGSETPSQQPEPAEEGQQLVDRILRCRPYHFSF